MRSAAQSALRAGLRPLGADLFADADLKRAGPREQIANYPEGLAAWLYQTECDGWLYTGGLENYPLQVSAMAAQQPLLGCDGEVLLEVRSPRRLADVLGAAGLRFPKTIPFPAASVSTSRPVPSAGTARRWLIKTCQGSGGSGVLGYLAAGIRYDQANRPHGDCYLQQWIDGSPCAALFLAHAGQAELLGLTKQLVGEPWTGASPFQYCGSIGPHPRMPDNMFAEIVRIGQALASTFGLVGLIGVDLILAGGRVWTVEVNPRYTAAVEIVERASGRPVLGLHLDACRQQTEEPEMAANAKGMDLPDRPRNYHGKAILFAQQGVTIRPEFTCWAFGVTGWEGWPQVADIPTPGTEIRAGQPVVTLFATGTSPSEVEQALRRRVAETQQKLTSQ